jgi:hypothetical protein
MNNVERWAKDKHPMIALLAPQMASFARDLPDIFRNLKKHQLFDSKAKLPHLPSWYALYRNHKRYCEPFAKMLVESSEFAQQLITLGVALQTLSERQDDLPTQTFTEDDLREGRLFWHNLKASSFAELRSEFEDRKLDYKTTATIQQYIKQFEMELSFVFLVFVPCFMLYQTSPGQLYHKALLGDKNAIDMLLRLDPFMLHDPSIGKQMQKIRLFGRQTTYQNLVEAPLKPIKAKITNNKIKTSMATLISMIAEALKQPLTSADIRELFDAIAQDADKHDEDSAIPRSSDTLGKAIQRKRATWQPLLKPDSKTCK